MLTARLFTNITKTYKRHFCNSALYVTGDKANTNFAVLTPYIDIEDRFADKIGLEANIEARKLYLNLYAIEKRWLFYLHLLDRKTILEHTKTEIGNEISKLLKDEVHNRAEIEKFKYHLRVVKDEYSVLKNYMYGVEESAALYALSLPNILHPKTPLDLENVIYTHGTQSTHESISHIDIGIEKNYLEYKNNSFVVLLNEAALFEYSIFNYFQNRLLDFDYIQFSNADFVKSVIIEGCGTDFNKDTAVISLQEEVKHPIGRLHLTGGATHFSFMAYLCKNSIMYSHLPLKYFASGRRYEPVTKSDPSLFNLMQQSAFEVCIATQDNNIELDNEFEMLLNCVIELYKSLNIHFRLVILPAARIRNFESLRLSIQMFSNHLQEYVEVGSVSICDDFLSKRLLFTYQENKERKFPKLIFGNILNVQKILACKIENNVNNALLCEILKQYSPL